MSDPTEIDDGGSAFPHKDFVESHPGMSKREYYAAKCLAGLLANPEVMKAANTKLLIEESVDAADLLIAELKKPVDTAQK